MFVSLKEKKKGQKTTILRSMTVVSAKFKHYYTLDEETKNGAEETKNKNEQVEGKKKVHFVISGP